MSAPEVILGVDFGTTNSVVAVCREDGVEVLTNDIDKRTTPSCVYKCDTDRGVGEVGEAALRMATSYPANTIRNVKSVLGLTLKALRGRTPLGSVKMGQSSSDGPVTLKIGERKFSHEEAVAMILLELKKTAEMQLQQKVNKAIIAVPSYFNASQRQALIDAAEMAGLEVPALVNETTAAAMAYAHDREVTKTVVIVDVGGGGCSLAVFKVVNNTVEVLAHSGPRLPGGEDFDAKMVEYLKECAEKTSGKKVTDPRDAEFLRSHWAKAKEKLSRILQATISVFLPDIELEFFQEVKRNEFQMQCAELFEEITDGILRLLQNAKVAVDEVDEVLLIGGSTRIPNLRDLIQKTFNGKALKTNVVNPDEAVAQGAALMAAKCVELKREVLSLITEIAVKTYSVEPTVKNIQRNTVLPHSIHVSRSATVEVEQEVEIGQMTPILSTSKDKYIHRLEVTESGLLHMHESRGRIECTLIGCLPPSGVKKQGEKVGTHMEKERMKSMKIEAKNALEKVLREERGRKISRADPFSDEVSALREECEKKLKWLEDHGDESIKDYDTVRGKFETKIATLNSKIEAEAQRVEARECLRETLQATADAAIPEDPFSETAKGLKQFCETRLVKLTETEKLTKEEYVAELNSVLSKKEALDRDRERDAAEKRRVESIKLFEEAIIQANMQRNHHRSNEANILIENATSWLLNNRATATDATLNEELQSFNQQLNSIYIEIRKKERKAEEDRISCYFAAEKDVKDAISTFKVPEKDDPLHMEITGYINHWKRELQYIQEHKENVTSKYLIDFSQKIKADILALCHKQNDEIERQRRKVALETFVNEGLMSSEFQNNTLFSNTLKMCRRWLNDNPLANGIELKKWRNRVDSVTSTLRSANCHRSKQEREEKSAEAALKKATEEMRAMLAELGYEFPDTQAPPPRQYVPEDFTEERMDVDSDGEHGHALVGDLRNRPVDDEALLEVWQRFHQPEGQQWLRLEPLRNFTPPQCKVMLESLSDELAVEALKSAAASRHKALLLDREVTPENEFVSLSVRYVRPDGNPVESLLFVRDKRRSDGETKDFAAHLILHFKKLCNAAGVQLQDCFIYLSAPDCGHLVAPFLQLLKEEKCTVSLANSVSEPLDKSVARACYEMEGVREIKNIVVNAFSVVDTFRQKFALSSQWLPYLERDCKFEDDRDPWATYTSSVAFLLVNRKELLELLDNITRSHPEEMLIMWSLSEHLKSFHCIACLVVLDSVFAVIQGASDQALETCTGWKAFLGHLDGHAGVITCYCYQENLKDRIIKTTESRYLKRDSKVHAIVDAIINSVLSVTNQALRGFEDCRVLNLCWNADIDKSSGHFDHAGGHFYRDLVECRKTFTKDGWNSPQRVLQRVPREEFLRKWPALFAALQRVLTVPLIPPAGQRSAVQLREGVLRASAVLPVLGVAAVPLALRTEPPSAATLSRAVARVLERCPELPGVREELCETMV